MSDMIFDEWVIGGSSHGRMRHAARRLASGSNIFPGAYTCSTLCGARGGDGVVRASNERYDPTLIDDPCTECARKWAALYAPQVEGWTKTCASCRTDKAITQFHADARTKDGLTKTCFACKTAAASAVREAERVLERAAQDNWRLEQATKHTTAKVAAMQVFQGSHLTSTFRCAADHALTPVTSTKTSALSGDTYPDAAWSCPCGVRTLDESSTDMRMLTDVVGALRILSTAPVPGPVDMTRVTA